MPKDKKAIKRDILNKFRAINGEANDILPPQWLVREYLVNLDRYEKKDFEKALQELMSKGFISYRKGAIPEIRLTEKGAALIH